ncbi:hypothetical protein AALB39_04150 [Lachnospiraceae bacterium 54-53]
MDSKKVIREFATIDRKTALSAQLIDGQKLYEYEEEYGTDLVHFSDKILFDILITKKKNYRMTYLSQLLTAYNMLYDYCRDKGYINGNPLEDSVYFQPEHLITKIASLGNVKLYSRDHIKQKCEEMQYNIPYYLSIALLIYEGVYDISTLASIKYSDVDFKKGIIHHDNLNIKISDELISIIREMYRMDQYEIFVQRGKTSYVKMKDFYDENNFLIRQVTKGKMASDDPKRHMKVISDKLLATGLNSIFLYDSGLIFRLVDEIGLEKFLDIMEFETKNRRTAEDVLLLQNLFDKWGVKVSVSFFVFNYRVYIPLLKYNKIL